mmetsp:Transcript_50329/g.107182  ORF Transcript_50329/g.107182 Transcript_50329/m.107182 type:complete len:221 (-) Transcript_50329:25-687(-)
MQQHVQPLERRDCPLQVSLGVIKALHVPRDLKHGRLTLAGLVAYLLDPRGQLDDGAAGVDDIPRQGGSERGLVTERGGEVLVQAIEAGGDGRAEGREGVDELLLGVVMLVQELYGVEIATPDADVVLFFPALPMRLRPPPSDGEGRRSTDRRRRTNRGRRAATPGPTSSSLRPLPSASRRRGRIALLPTGYAATPSWQRGWRCRSSMGAMTPSSPWCGGS